MGLFFKEKEIIPDCASGEYRVDENDNFVCSCIVVVVGGGGLLFIDVYIFFVRLNILILLKKKSEQ